MWLPPSIYERVPQLMLLLGLLFMFSAAYLRFDNPFTKIYFGTGVVCFLWSLWVMTVRLRHRKPQHHTEDAEPESAAVSAEDKEGATSEPGA